MGNKHLGVRMWDVDVLNNGVMMTVDEKKIYKLDGDALSLLIAVKESVHYFGSFLLIY